MLTSSFEDAVLYRQARAPESCSALRIVTGFTDCDRILTHADRLQDGMQRHEFPRGMSVDIILGMTKTSLSRTKHERICELMRNLEHNRSMPRVSCNYIFRGPEVHSKVFVWRNESGPRKAFCGSLNYTMNAFYKRREAVVECDPYEADAYYDELFPDTINCLDQNVLERLSFIEQGTREDNDDGYDTDEATYDSYNVQRPVDTLYVSLLFANGEQTGHGSGVNWGIRKNGTKRDPDQAYIPYNTKDKKEGFFPDREYETDKNCPMFKVITKDFGSFHMRMAQANNKGLHSVENNAILGRWIRKLLDVRSGVFITKQMLERYGTTDVVFRKYADGVYLLDFDPEISARYGRGR